MNRRQIGAIDLGASGGRVMGAGYDGERLFMKELHIFANEPVVFNGTMYWDILRLFHEIKIGLAAAGRQGGADSVSVYTWGVDFGLLDAEGRLMENPVHYRDGRTKGMVSRVLEKIPGESLYRLTGQWAEKLLGRLHIPGRLFQPVVRSGTRLGSLREELKRELGIGSVEVIATAGHDTQAAMAAVPAEEDDFIFISCGTWALVGTELDRPIISRESMKYNVTNELGCGGRVSFLRNLTGTWLIQESRRQWKREGREYTFGQLEELAEKAERFKALIDPDAGEFASTGHMPERIRQAARKTGQHIPDSEGEIIRCIDESLAFKYRSAVEEIKACTGREYRRIYLVGGGAQSRLLCQMTANACNLPVTAGPVEATAAGNMGIQLMALGELADMGELRDMIRRSFPLAQYEPENTGEWEEQYQRFRGLYSGGEYED